MSERRRGARAVRRGAKSSAAARPAGGTAAFARRVIAWQCRHGRHGLPWQGTRDPYRIWLAEVMLQQTRVGAALGYYERFTARFPDLRGLARAPLEQVLGLWAGLGYYSRARNLHRAARLVEGELGGSFPRERRELERLPGIGRSTAAAIAVFAFGAREPILDGNARRVLARHFAAGGPGLEKRLWAIAQSLVPARGVETYTQGLMDLGATLCTRISPACGRCPLGQSCAARAQGRIAEYPPPRARGELPLRETAMLLLVHRGRVLLHRRPPAGIWGGLWSPPEAPPGADPRAHCARLLGCEIGAVRALERLRHGFTHFRLDILPLHCEVSRVLPRAREPGSRWFAIGGVLPAAVPAPVKTLLGRLGTPHSGPNERGPGDGLSSGAAACPGRGRAVPESAAGTQAAAGCR